jgi:hypothetical protein
VHVSARYTRFLAGIILLWGAAGCAPARQPDDRPRPHIAHYDARGHDNDGDGDRRFLSGANSINNPPVNLSAVRNGERVNGGVTAFGDGVARLAQTISGVDAARAVVDLPNAFVAVRLHRGIENDARRIDAIRREVRMRLLTMAPSIQNVYVATDRATAARIETISDRLNAGAKIGAVRQELHNLQAALRPVPPSGAPRHVRPD